MIVKHGHTGLKHAIRCSFGEQAVIGFELQAWASESRIEKDRISSKVFATFTGMSLNIIIPSTKLAFFG